MELLEDEILLLCREVFDYNIGKYEMFYDVLEGEMEGCFINIVFFGMCGFGKFVLINFIYKVLDFNEEFVII